MIPGQLPSTVLPCHNRHAFEYRPNALQSASVAACGNGGAGADFSGHRSMNYVDGPYLQNGAAAWAARGFNSRTEMLATLPPRHSPEVIQPKFFDGGSPLHIHRGLSYKRPWTAHHEHLPPTQFEDPVASSSVSDYSVEPLPSDGYFSREQIPVQKQGTHRRPSKRDEFDGPHQFLQRPSPKIIEMQERELPHLPTNLHVQEQDAVLRQVNDRLSQCAFDFVAKYQFPIPLTQDMRPVERPQDREWTEWVYLLKRLATKRRIPARVLYNWQIKQLVTTLENSLEMRHAAKHQSRPLKDDRNILQLISAGIQVAKILKDASAMECLDRLYVNTETRILDRTKGRPKS